MTLDQLINIWFTDWALLLLDPVGGNGYCLFIICGVSHDIVR